MNGSILKSALGRSNVKDVIRADLLRLWFPCNIWRYVQISFDLLPRYAMRKRGLCCRPLSVWLSRWCIVYPHGWRYRQISCSAGYPRHSVFDPQCLISNSKGNPCSGCKKYTCRKVVTWPSRKLKIRIQTHVEIIIDSKNAIFFRSTTKSNEVVAENRFRTVASPGACERLAVLNWRSSTIHPSSLFIHCIGSDSYAMLEFDAPDHWLLNTTIRRRLPGKFTWIHQFLFYIPKSGFGDISSVLLGFEK